MHIRIRHFITLALLAGAAYAGYRYEATQIQATCDSDTAVTWINGSAYLCVTTARAQEIANALHQRGA